MRRWGEERRGSRQGGDGDGEARGGAFFGSTGDSWCVFTEGEIERENSDSTKVRMISRKGEIWGFAEERPLLSLAIESRAHFPITTN